MNLIPKRRFEGNPTDFGNQAQQAITDFKRLNVGTAQIKDASITNAKIGLLAVDTAQIAALAVTNAKIGALAVTDAKIDTLTVAKLTTGNFTATGTLTTSGVLKSANYVADTAGWQVDYAGNAEFNSVKVRGSIYTSSIVSGNTLTVAGAISAGGGGILLDTSGIEVIGEGQMIRFFATAPTGTPRALIQDTATGLYITTNTGIVGVSAAEDLWLTAVGKIFASSATAIDFANVAYIDMARSTFAGTPAVAEGRFFYNLTSHVMQYHNGTVWKVVATV